MLHVGGGHSEFHLGLVEIKIKINDNKCSFGSWKCLSCHQNTWMWWEANPQLTTMRCVSESMPDTYLLLTFLTNWESTSHNMVIYWRASTQSGLEMERFVLSACDNAFSANDNQEKDKIAMNEWMKILFWGIYADYELTLTLHSSHGGAKSPDRTSSNDTYEHQWLFTNNEEMLCTLWLQMKRNVYAVNDGLNCWTKTLTGLLDSQFEDLGAKSIFECKLLGGLFHLACYYLECIQFGVNDGTLNHQMLGVFRCLIAESAGWVSWFVNNLLDVWPCVGMACA